MAKSVFANYLVKVETQEANIAAKYNNIIPENKVTKTLKEQDVNYRTQEFKKKMITINE